MSAIGHRDRGRNHRFGVEWTCRARRAAAVASACAIAAGFLAGPVSASIKVPTTPAKITFAKSGHYVVEAKQFRAASSAVKTLHGTVLENLSGIGAVVARLSHAQATAIGQLPGIIVTPDVALKLQSVGPQPGSSTDAPAHTPSAVFPQVTNATQLWANGITGSGVGVAVLDTGIERTLPDFYHRVIAGVDLSGESGNAYQDGYGHGTFVAGVIAGNGSSSGGQYTGEAPGADLISIKVAGADGSTSLGQVIAGILWAVKHQHSHNIDVLNISLGVIPPGPSIIDPLDLAVDFAWRSGITVVVSAGNSGPSNGTITAPGDDPLAITVGALDDGGANNSSNFSIPSFSSVGPTLFDGNFKPDVVASGRSVVSVTSPGSTVYNENPSARIGQDNFVGSGTSFSSAIVSGIAALVLQKNPNLTPDEVKARILGTATAGPTGNPFVDGHGTPDAYAAATAAPVELDQSALASGLSFGTLDGTPTVSLGKAWTASSWNPANWSGVAWNGVAWNGVAWNGVAWNGVAWNGVAWNGVAWNGPFPTGVAWNGTTWNGVAWNGVAWNGVAWNGVAWNGVAWNGVAWNGVAWNGVAWNGVAWNGVAWNGVAWNGVAWNGVAWNGVAWNGVAWNGVAWNGVAWNGVAWNGVAWNLAAWD